MIPDLIHGLELYKRKTFVTNRFKVFKAFPPSKRDLERALIKLRESYFVVHCFVQHVYLKEGCVKSLPVWQGDLCKS